MIEKLEIDPMKKDAPKPTADASSVGPSVRLAQSESEQMQKVEKMRRIEYAGAPSQHGKKITWKILKN